MMLERKSEWGKIRGTKRKGGNERYKDRREVIRGNTRRKRNV